MKLVLSCEHGGNEIPGKYQNLFLGKEEVLKTHRGFDFGTLDLFEHLKTIVVFSKSNSVSRLLIDCNRSLQHPKLFSEFTKDLSLSEKENIIQKYYLAYRFPIEKFIQNEIEKRNKIFHISLHSFTPELNEETRNNDIGLLYDPKRFREKELCKALKLQLLDQSPDLKIRFNYPYLGTADGFTSYLRKKFPSNYFGIELEINQALVSNGTFSNSLKAQIKHAFSRIMQK